MNTINKQHILTAEAYVRPFFERDHSGHDWGHIQRVRRNALFICKQESCQNPQAVELISLLHDVSDLKLHETYEVGQNALEKVLKELSFTRETELLVKEAIVSVSFNGGHEKSLPCPEAAIVRDADRLDAIGAIGIARTFAYGGSRGAKMYDDEIRIRENMTEKEYRSETSTTVHHFYEKLLKLKNLMVTETGEKLAHERHQFMESYLKQFLKEWKGQA